METRFRSTNDSIFNGRTRPVGDLFKVWSWKNFRFVLYQVAKAESEPGFIKCLNCDLYETGRQPACKATAKAGICFKDGRPDRTSVIFKRIEP